MSYQEFKLSVGYWLYKHSIIEATLAVLFIFIGFVSSATFVILTMLYTVSYYYNNLIFLKCYGVSERNALLYIILALLFAFLSFSLERFLTKNSSNTNWRVAIDEAKEFKQEHPDLSAKIDMLVGYTRQSKNSQKLNKWLGTCRQLVWQKRELEKLKQRQSELAAKIIQTEKTLEQI